jgi:glutaminase
MHDEPFSIQSIASIFTLSLTAWSRWDAALWNYVGREPSGSPFNALVQPRIREGQARAIRLTNAGAIVV